jgi:antirestriction protein
MSKCLTSDIPRIYVACLASYNNGFLHGVWIDANQEEDEILVEVKAMLAASPVTELYGEVAEEWAIHDYEGFHGVEISEYESISKVAQLAQELEEHGAPYAAYLGYFSDGTVDDFEGKYRGCFESKKAFAYDLYEQDGTTAKVTATVNREVELRNLMRELNLPSRTITELVQRHFGSECRINSMTPAEFGQLLTLMRQTAASRSAPPRSGGSLQVEGGKTGGSLQVEDAKIANLAANNNHQTNGVVREKVRV